jgi:hypothetical protein
VHAGALSSPPLSLGEQSTTSHTTTYCSALPSVLALTFALAYVFAPVLFAPLFLAVAVAVAVLPSRSLARAGLDPAPEVAPPPPDRPCRLPLPALAPWHRLSQGNEAVEAGPAPSQKIACVEPAPHSSAPAHAHARAHAHAHVHTRPPHRAAAAAL